MKSLKETLRILLNGLFFSYKRGKTQALCGNYLIIEGAEGCALLAHLKTGSIKPEVGNSVRTGELVAELGHSGNSSAPHLHFQLMDRVDLKSAKGVPCCFDTYEINRNGKWESVRNAIPTKTDVVRFGAD